MPFVWANFDHVFEVFMSSLLPSYHSRKMRWGQVCPWMGVIAKLIFFNHLFLFFIGSLMTSKQSAIDWDWRILQACFRVSSAACPALMVLEKVWSDSLSSLLQKAISFVPQTIIHLAREFTLKFHNSRWCTKFLSQQGKQKT